MRKNLGLSVVVGLAATLASTTAYSSGYAVNMFSSYAAGMANAGHGVQDDPMLSLVNPAAMILNKSHHLAGQLTGVFPEVKFKGRATNSAIPNVTPGIPYDKTDTTRNAGVIAGIPTGGFVWRVYENLRFSLAMNAPYGLKFKYGTDSVTRFHTQRAAMMTVNISPSVAYRVHDMVTLGAGLQAQYTKVKLKRSVGIPVGTNKIGTINLRVDDWDFGWTAGVLLNLTKQWNLGVSYRSNIDTKLEGKISISNPSFGTLVGITPVTIPAFNSTGDATAKAFIPHVVTLSTSYALNNCWTVYGSAVWTNWKTTKNLTINSNLFTNTGSNVRDVIEQGWKDVWFFSAGANYKINDCYSVRTGVGFDQSPTKDSTRIPALPDSDKWWLGLGLTHTMGKMSTTLSYGHEFFKKGKVNLKNNATLTKSTLVGKINAHIDFVSLQLNIRL